MYFYKLKGRQMLDLRGDLVLSHNDKLVRSRISSAAPRGVRNATYVEALPSKSWWKKLRVSFQALRFIWGRSQALESETIKEDGI